MWIFAQLQLSSMTVLNKSLGQHTQRRMMEMYHTAATMAELLTKLYYGCELLFVSTHTLMIHSLLLDSNKAVKSKGAACIIYSVLN